MTWWEAALLGLIQGLTEFLPISSSGHLVLGKYFLGLDATEDASVTFEVFVHFGTALSIITVYWNRIFSLLKGSLTTMANPSKIIENYERNERFRLVVFILITMIPTGLAYILLKDFIEASFQNPRMVFGMLIVTGILLLLTMLRKAPSGNITPLKALVIGIAQAAAMMPGISRSGSTICTALYQNVSPEKAADFSFLMLLPIVIGAAAIQSFEVFQSGFTIGAVPLIIGTVIAYVSGIIAIHVVLDFVRKGRLLYFAFYCFAVGITGLFLV